MMGPTLGSAVAAAVSRPMTATVAAAMATTACPRCTGGDNSQDCDDDDREVMTHGGGVRRRGSPRLWALLTLCESPDRMSAQSPGDVRSIALDETLLVLTQRGISWVCTY